MATGQDEDAPTEKHSAINRIQAMRAQIRPNHPQSRSDPVHERGPATLGHDGSKDANSQHAGSPPDDLSALIEQQDATIAALRAEIALLKREIIEIAARLTTLGDATEVAGDD